MIRGGMKIADVMRTYPQTVSVFCKFGLDCSGCQIAEYEEIAHGASVHDVDLEALLAALNAVISE